MISERQPFSKEHSLERDNQQLKHKYRKSLQELMHLLKVNRSLKDYLDQLQLTTSHQTSLPHHSVISQLEQKVREANEQATRELETRQQVEQQNAKILLILETLEHQNTALKQEISTLSSKLEQIESNSYSPASLHRPTPSVATVNELDKERQTRQAETSEWRAQIQQMTAETVLIKENYRHEMQKKEQEWWEERMQLRQKVQNLTTELEIVQRQTEDYRNIDHIFANNYSSRDEDRLIQGLREQIERLNQQIQEEHKSQEQGQGSGRQRSLSVGDKANNAEYEELVEVLRSKVKKQEKQLIELQTNNDLKSKGLVGQLAVENSQLRERIQVLEALTHTQRHRNSPQLTHRLQEFETRIQLLTDTPLSQNNGLLGGLQQTTVLKGYILELSHMLNVARRREETLQKKVRKLKNKVGEMVNTEHHNKGVYKRRIEQYEKLLNRLYGSMEEKAQQQLPDSLQKEIRTVVRQYETKVKEMSQSIMLLQRENKQLEKLRETERVKLQNKLSLEESFEQETERMKDIINALSQQINYLQTQNLTIKTQGLAIREDEIVEKNRLVEEMANEIRRQEAVIVDLREKEIQNATVLLKYEQELLALKAELEGLESINATLRQRSIDTASLIEKVNYLEHALKQRHGQHTSVQDESISILREELIFKSTQVAFCRAQIERLTQIIDQIQLNAASTGTDQSLLAQIDRLTRQNRSLVEQVHSKHSQMMEYYNQLHTRIIREGETAQQLHDMQKAIQKMQEMQQTQREKETNEVFEANAQLITIRTANFELRKEIQEKEVEIEELKHQVYVSSLEHHKSGSLTKTKDDEEELSRLRVQLTFAEAQIEQLKVKHSELERTYNQETDRYRQALLELEARQEELTYSLQFTNTEKRITDKRLPAGEVASREEIWRPEKGSHRDFKLGVGRQDPKIGSFQDPANVSIRPVLVESKVSISESDSPLGRRCSIKIKKIQ